ncbi:hypothetical protein BN1708_002365 [Verticillium longisporum]|uniref:Rap-GAP domain-containing protein n=1 Tax=Verticillium longisporum TaxID=100787 RepID=A0A0G4KQ72_VERLO|nr:hypothetical protein BN1708_002365 [Verticillium longisporum]
MSRSPGDVASSPDSSRAGGLANVFKGLTGAKLTKSPPPIAQSIFPPVISPMVDRPTGATPVAADVLSRNHMEAFEQLKNGSPNERVAAADSLRYAISEYPLSPVLDIWYAAKDLIDAGKASAARIAGWELLAECVKHKSSTDLERKEFFQTLTAPANPEDFHLQLASLVDLTNHGRDLSGFDYDVIPLLRKWLREAYQAVKVARKHASRDAKRNPKLRVSVAGEEKNLQQLFTFIVEVTKFSSNVADETALAGLVNALVAICLNTIVEDDLRACIGVIDAIVTFGSLPSGSFRECVLVLGSIFCLVPNLHKPAWHTLSIILKSHNGHATVRVLLDLLRDLPADGNSKGKDTRDIRGALAVLEKLVAKSTEKGYPTVPFTLLMNGLVATVQCTPSARVHCAVLKLLNSLFSDSDGKLHHMIAEENWTTALSIATECSKKATQATSGDNDATKTETDSDRPYEAIRRELLRMIARLESLMTSKNGSFVPRPVVIQFFMDVHTLIPDSTAVVVLDYFQEFRCCSPSDLEWEDNLALVRQGFFGNRQRSSHVRLLALRSITDAYEMMDLVGEEMEEDCIATLVKDLLSDVSAETDVAVLDALVSLMVDVAIASDLELFNFITSTLKSLVVSDRLEPPASQSLSPGAPPTLERSPFASESSKSDIVTQGFVRLFMRCMNANGLKSAKLFDILVSIARGSHNQIDARLTAMKLLFRLRADWASSIFLTVETEAEGLAASLYRTEASLARKQAGDATLSARASRAEHGGPVRSARAISFSHAGTQDRSYPIRSVSGAQKMAQIITQPHVAMHILEFLAGLSRLPALYVNFREEEYRIVFGICIRYLQYVRDKQQNHRALELSATTVDGNSTSTDDLPQYVYSLAHHVITFWFLALRLPDRSNHVGWIAKNLFANVESGQGLEEQAMVTIDFMQRVAYADANESSCDPLFTKERFGEILTRRWLIGNSIVTIEQATATGWAQITKRQPSGTSSYIVRENFRPPPAHQTMQGAEVVRASDHSNNVLPSHLMVQLMTSIPQTSESLRPIPLPDDDAVQRAVRVFDRNSTVDGHKVGVIYIGEGQTDEVEILSNVSGSSDYVEFLNGLGTLTKLKGSTFNTQGLDREYDSDGQYTFCWRDRVTEMVFHVITQMPTNLDRDPQCILKKRHIGNDFVNIIFNDSGHPFRFDTFPSEFNYVNIVITPESRASFIASREAPPADKQQFMPFYKVQLMSKPGFPTISPASETKMVSLKALPGFIRLLALNASVFSLVWANREGGDTVSSWRNRLREIKRLREKHGYTPATPTNHQITFGQSPFGQPQAGGPTPSPPTTSLGGGHHGGSLAAATHSQAAADLSRPASSVRDSFGSSLRRSSVATFFTSTSEQTSHRSSMLSTTTTTNDTEISPSTGLDSLVESVDFSRWA